MKQMWDQRYSGEEYVYGTEPNAFFKKELMKLPVGKILLPAEGEGRNAIFAASQGWEVVAYDTSVEGKKKALKLAESKEVKIQYEISSYQEYKGEASSFDAIGLFFTHQPAEMRTSFHKSLQELLKPSGFVIMEAFNKEQIHLSTGGPNNLDFLFSEQELRDDFSYLKDLEITETYRELDEGVFHQGKAAVIQLTGRI